MSCPLQGLLSRAAPNKRCVFRALTLCGARWTTKAVATMQVARVSCKLQVASACGVASWYWMPIYFQQTWPTNCPQRERGRERERGHATVRPICALQLPRRRRRRWRRCSCCIFMVATVIYTARMAKGNWQMAQRLHWLLLLNFQ